MNGRGSPITRDETGGSGPKFWGREFVARLESPFPKLRRFLRKRVDLPAPREQMPAPREQMPAPREQMPAELCSKQFVVFGIKSF